MCGCRRTVSCPCTSGSEALAGDFNRVWHDAGHSVAERPRALPYIAWPISRCRRLLTILGTILDRHIESHLPAGPRTAPAAAHE